VPIDGVVEWKDIYGTAKNKQRLVAPQRESQYPGMSLQIAVRIDQTIGIWIAPKWKLKRSHGRLLVHPHHSTPRQPCQVWDAPCLALI
jgi:hypothetical protein